MITVGVAHSGTQHFRQTALAFQEASALRWYATGSYYYKASAWPDRAVGLLPAAWRGQAETRLGRRRLAQLDDALVRRAFETDLIEAPLVRLLSRNQRGRAHYRRGQRFPRRVLKLFEREPVDALWATVDCLEVFRELKPRGVLCILDQTTGHAAALDRALRDEHDRHPDFFFGKKVGVAATGLARQSEAADIADLIVVGSSFAARSMVENGVDPGKLRIVPYGYDEGLFPREAPERPPIRARPVEFVFVGWIGAMKGAAYLLEAFRGIDPAKARLTLVGPLEMPKATFARYADCVSYVGRLPHADVAGAMSRADGFIFPSMFEGGGIVLYEAAACGLGVIQTAACGDGVRGANGVVLPDVSVEAIIGAVEAAIDGETLRRWGEASWRIRGERTWDRYRAAAVRVALEACGAPRA